MRFSTSATSFVAFVSAAMVPGTFPSAAQEYKVKPYVSQGIQNMRSGPGVGHDVVIAIPAGSRGVIQVGDCSRPDDGSSKNVWCEFRWERYRGWISKGGLEAVASASPQRGGRDGSLYPIVFQSGGELKQLGIALEGWGKQVRTTRFHNRCYYYGDGGYSMSVSDKLLEKYKRRGFSLNSLCMGLQSPIAFDPETGKRLPSYMVADTDAIERGEIGAGTVTDVLPLRIPNCYRRGLPYHDCRFNYDIRTGKRLTSSQLSTIQRGKRIFDSKMSQIRQNGAYSKECRCASSNLQSRFSETNRCRLEKVPKCPLNDDESLIVGTLRAEGYFVYGLFAESAITLVDISPSLPLGYGYALMTDGAAAPDGGDPRTAADSSRRSSDAKLAAAANDM